MIDCSSDNIWYKKRKNPFKLKRIFSFFILVIMLILLGVYYFKVVTYNVYDYTSNYIYNYCSESLNYSILDLIDDSVVYEDIVNIEKDSGGNIVLISYNSFKINSIARNVVSFTKHNLKQSLERGVPIPIASFFGLNYFSSIGKKVNFKNLNVSSVDCEFDSSFTASGINQTIHSIYIIINSKVFTNLPLYKKQVECSSKILISENVIVGKVPEFYLNGKLSA